VFEDVEGLAGDLQGIFVLFHLSQNVGLKTESGG